MSNTKQTPESIVFDATRAIRELDQSRRQSCQDHNDRARKLKRLVEHLIAGDGTQGELFDAESALTLELKQLIANPMRGL